MDENQDIYQQEIVEEDDALMPDGYAEGDDFFNPDAWTGDKESESASEDEAPATSEETPNETGSDPAPATEPGEVNGSADTGDNGDAPATGEEPATPTKRRVKFQFDHQDVEEEYDDDSLPEVFQKARSVDRYKQRLDMAQAEQIRLSNIARSMNFKTSQEFLDAIVENAKSSERDAFKSKGLPDEIADDYITRKYAGTAAAAPQTQTPPVESPNGRNYIAEAQEFQRAYPNIKGTDLPEEVKQQWGTGTKSLVQLYTEYERKQSQAEADKAKKEAEDLRKELRILKNNADAADRAPVSGVSKGGKTNDKDASDPFLQGFNSVFD